MFPRLKERERQAAGRVSGGEQQMLAIGRCLMGSPRLVMLDEPSMGLAPTYVLENGRMLEITLVGSRVSVLRRRSSDGNDCDYVGQLSAKQVAGTYRCTRHPTPMPWQATISP